MRKQIEFFYLFYYSTKTITIVLREKYMDPKNLKYFVAVAQYGSINAAAKAMFISQPQLSHIIKGIEVDVVF